MVGRLTLSDEGDIDRLPPRREPRCLGAEHPTPMLTHQTYSTR